MLNITKKIMSTYFYSKTAKSSIAVKNCDRCRKKQVIVYSSFRTSKSAVIMDKSGRGRGKKHGRSPGNKNHTLPPKKRAAKSTKMMNLEKPPTEQNVSQENSVEPASEPAKSIPQDQPLNLTSEASGKEKEQSTCSVSTLKVNSAESRERNDDVPSTITTLVSPLIKGPQLVAEEYIATTKTVAPIMSSSQASTEQPEYSVSIAEAKTIAAASTKSMESPSSSIEDLFKSQLSDICDPKVAEAIEAARIWGAPQEILDTMEGMCF